MSTTSAASPDCQGPYAYENWRLAAAGSNGKGASEFPLFTDAHVTGELSSGYGPYQFFNTVPSGPLGELKPAIVLRMEHHLDYDPAKVELSKSTTDRYHGGSLTDELAALLSLSLGIRLKAGGSTRRFEPTGDPRGRPHAWSFHDTPVLLKSAWLGVILPHQRGTCSMNGDRLLVTLPRLSAQGANSLVRAARLYQDGIWVAESEPHLSWIMLVSAVESAADHWRGAGDSAVDRLAEALPDLVSMLKEAGGDALVAKAADLLSNRIGATKTFVDFLVTFLPPPPPARPHAWAQLAWGPDDLRPSFRKIYHWRSRALHEGVPFPLPMCMPPLRVDDLYAETPTGLAAAGMGGVWIAEDTPMLLHTFEYIVRGALKNWWLSLAGTS